MPVTSPARIIVGGMSEVDVLKRNYQVTGNLMSMYR